MPTVRPNVTVRILGVDPGSRRTGFGTAYTLPFYQALRLPQAGGVDYRDRIAPKIEFHFNQIAGGARLGRDDRHLAFGDRVKQA